MVPAMSGDEDESPFPEPVEIPIEESIDLHFFRPSEVADVLDAYLEAARERGFPVRGRPGRPRRLGRHARLAAAHLRRAAPPRASRYFGSSRASSTVSGLR
jgi:hypothetical protein